MFHDYPTKLDERLSQYAVNGCARSRSMYLKACSVKGIMLSEDERRYKLADRCYPKEYKIALGKPDK